METVTRDSISGVSRLSLHADYYVKKFNGRKDWLKQLLGISRFQRERRNLKYFGSLGLATPAVVAIEERRVAERAEPVQGIPGPFRHSPGFLQAA